MDGILVVLGIVMFAFVISIPWRGRRSDPMDQGPVMPKPVAYREPKINQKVKDREWAVQYVHHVATSGSEALTDEMVREGYSWIINNRALSHDAKYYMLDGLYQRTMNDHPNGMAADVLEEISNESIALDHPEWHGRHGDWDSVRAGE